MGLFAALGVLLALVLTLVFPDNDQYSSGQIFGFLALFCGTIGLVFGAGLALLIDRLLSRRSRSMIAERENTVSDD